MLDPAAKRLFSMLGLLGPANARGDIAARREGFGSLMRFCPAPAHSGPTQDHRIDGPGGTLGLRLYRPAKGAAEFLPGLVFCHGGGLVAGSLDTHDALCRTLANATGCVLLAVDYRLAPEHKFPAALEDCRAAAAWVHTRARELGLDPQRIGIGGDSAGGSLAAIVCQNGGQGRFAFQLLLCPILDYGLETASRSEYGTPVLDEAMLRQDLACYLPEGIGAADARISPLRAEGFAGLPRTFLLSGACDPLRDEAAAYAGRLAAAGVDVTHTCVAGMPHLFYAMGRVIPQGARALQAIGAEVRKALAG
jgi:acetyl esterase/lipase